MHNWILIPDSNVQWYHRVKQSVTYISCTGKISVKEICEPELSQEYLMISIDDMILPVMRKFRVFSINSSDLLDPKLTVHEDLLTWVSQHSEPLEHSHDKTRATAHEHTMAGLFSGGQRIG